MTLEMEVSGLAGYLCTISTNAEANVRDLKAMVASQLQLDPRGLRLILNKRELRGAGLPLAGLDSGSKVFVTLLKRSSEQMEWLDELEVTDDVPQWLKHAPDAAKADHEVVLTAVGLDAHALKHASQEFCSDCEVILAAVAQDGWLLWYAGNKLKSDRVVVSAAVSQCGLALYHASPELKRDREVVLIAVAEDGHALHHAHPELKNDREVVLAAIAQAGGESLLAKEFDVKGEHEAMLVTKLQSAILV